MVKVVSKQCMHAGCTTFPCFGFLEDGIPLRCKAHELAGRHITCHSIVAGLRMSALIETDDQLVCQL